MRFGDAIDLFVADWRAAGRIGSPRTEATYRRLLELHADDVGNRDPRATGRADVKRTLGRWEKPNTIRGRRAVLVSFYDWAMEEGLRRDNPARQTRRPKKRPTAVYRLTREEVLALQAACRDPLERRAIFLGTCAGLRSAELRGLRGRHLDRDGWIHVSADIAKGGRERWVPVTRDLEAVVAEIRTDVGASHFVLHARRVVDPPRNSRSIAVPERPMGATTIYRLVRDLARRAGIGAHVHPHLLRHAYCDHIARHAGLTTAQALMGHADVSTTQGYVGRPTLEELAGAVRDVSFLPAAEAGAGGGGQAAGIGPAFAAARARR